MVSQRKENIDKAIARSEQRSFIDDVENDKSIMQNMLSRPDKSKNDPNANEAEQALEQERAGVLKRLALVIGSGDMQINSGGHNLSASDNTLPIASYMAGHAGRVMIEIPPAGKGSEHQFFNWLTSGDSKTNPNDHHNPNVSTNFSGAEAETDGKIIFNRRAATHAAVVKDGKMVEKKTNAAYEFFADVIPSFVSERKHWGMNIAAGGYGEKDVHGNEIKADGAHGHLYMYYQPPTKDKPGAILVGLEGTEPHVKGELGEHSLVGAADKLTAFGGKKWNGSKVLDDQSKGKVAVNDKYSGLTVSLNASKIEELYRQDTASIPSDIGSRIPAKDVKSLIDNPVIHTKETIEKAKTLEERGVLREAPIKQKEKFSFIKFVKSSFSKINPFSAAKASVSLEQKSAVSSMSSVQFTETGSKGSNQSFKKDIHKDQKAPNQTVVTQNKFNFVAKIRAALSSYKKDPTVNKFKVEQQVQRLSQQLVQKPFKPPTKNNAYRGH